MLRPNWSSRPVDCPYPVDNAALETTSPVSKLDGITTVEVLCNVKNKILFLSVDVVQVIIESLGYIVGIGVLHGTQNGCDVAIHLVHSEYLAISHKRFGSS